MLLFAILAVFIAGLMVGRTPEYIGKKIEQKEVKMAMLALIIMAANILIFAGISSVAKFRQNGYWNPSGRCHRQYEQRRPPRLQRNTLCLHQHERKQRQRLRRA